MKKAFTLAEILITLTLLGTVAAIVIPNAVQNYKKKQTITNLKIAYSLLTDLTEQSRIINDGIPPLNEGKVGFDKYVRPFVQITKDCGTGEKKGNNRCFASPTGSWYTFGGTEATTAAWYHQTSYLYKVVLKNGMSLAYDDCSSCMQWHRIFVVDIDGPKKGYSRLGQDVFIFEWGANSNEGVGYGRSVNQYYGGEKQPELVPYVVPVTNYDYIGGWRRIDISKDTKMNNYSQSCINKNGGSETIDNGTTCAGLIILNDWKFPSNYPWNYVNQSPNDFQPVN